jgi:hypothetical protein
MITPVAIMAGGIMKLIKPFTHASTLPKLVISLCFCMLASFSYSQEWAGLYHGKVSGKDSQLTLNRAGSDVIGILDSEGFRYKLEGSLQHGRLIGFCRDIKTGKVGQLSASTTTDVIIISVVLPGYHRPARLVFKRAEGVDPIFSEVAAL